MKEERGENCDQDEKEERGENCDQDEKEEREENCDQDEKEERGENCDELNMSVVVTDNRVLTTLPFSIKIIQQYKKEA
jgi:hypothetical protein